MAKIIHMKTKSVLADFPSEMKSKRMVETFKVENSNKLFILAHSAFIAKTLLLTIEIESKKKVG